MPEPDAFRTDLLVPVLSAAAMRAADDTTIHGIGIPGLTLMESAGREAARIAAQLVAPASRVLICCGKGNNGGDGLVMARWLAEAGYRVDVRVAAPAESLSPDAAAHLAILQRWPGTDLHVETNWKAPFDLPAADLIVDALFGTGLTSSLREPFDALVQAINAQGAPILALDIPSGLSSDTGFAPDPCIRATATVTMGALKSGLLLTDGPDMTGRVHVADIGIPRHVMQIQTAKEGSAHLSTDAWVRVHLRPRTRKDHKYTTGPALVLGGSQEYPGAPVLSARAAARIGSGYVVAAGPSGIRANLLEKLDAIPVAEWDPSRSDAAMTLIESLESRWANARALLIGPGMGRAESTGRLLWDLLECAQAPVILDADALWHVAAHRERIAALSGGRWILTPHDGEATRLEGDVAPLENRVERVRALARDWNCVVLLKGQPSLTATPDGQVVINATGHPAAATAGSGDVLAGIVTGLVAQGLEPAVAAAAGIHIGGTAAARFVERGPSQSMIAPDVIEMLPFVLGSLS